LRAHDWTLAVLGARKSRRRLARTTPFLQLAPALDLAVL